MHSRLWNTIDRWGPGAIAILTLCFVIVMGWQNSSKLSRLQAKIESVEYKLVMQSNQDNRTDRLEVGNLQRQLTEMKRDFGEKIEVESQKSMKTREKLIKKGWIDP